MVTHRTLYLVALVSWFTYVILFPTWVGRLYNEDVGGTGAFHEGGVFGLEGAEGFTEKGPLWDRPQPRSDARPSAGRGNPSRTPPMLN